MSRPSRSFAVLAVVLGALALGACGARDATVGGGGGGPVVVATTTQVGDLVRNVAGARAGVRQILSANSDPHAFEPRPSDVRAVTGAKVVVRSGGDLDDWLGGVLDNAGSHARAVDLIDAIRTRRGEGGVDPHWWQDPRNAEIAVGRIRDALVAADPGGARGVRRQCRGLPRAPACARSRDRRLHDGDPGRQAPARDRPRRARLLRRPLRHRGHRHRSIPALSTQAQASAGAVARLVRTIRRTGVTTIYSETSANTKLARAIARDAGAVVGPALYADALGPAGSLGATYIGSLRANTLALARAGSAAAARAVSCRAEGAVAQFQPLVDPHDHLVAHRPTDRAL